MLRACFVVVLGLMACEARVLPDASIPDAGSNTPIPCERDEDCTGRALCEGGLCRAGRLAEDGTTCVSTCLAIEARCATPCGPGEQCVDGACAAGCAASQCDTGCGATGVCDPNTGACEAPAMRAVCRPTCGADEACTETCRLRVANDPCAGVTCASGERCRAGTCEVDPCEAVPCQDGATCVDGRCVDPCRCGDGCAAGTECVDGVCACRPYCAPDAACGSDDGCGGSCFGPCDGLCVASGTVTRTDGHATARYACVCQPTCSADAACGSPDGCGGTCDGTCGAGQRCAGRTITQPNGEMLSQFACECAPSCDESEVACGSSLDDGCGGECVGTRCGTDQLCTAGRCVCDPTCDPADTAATACGVPVRGPCGNNCGYNGTRCPNGFSCRSGNCECVPSCPAASTVACGVTVLETCTGRECGTTGTQCAVGRCNEGTCCECPTPAEVPCGESIASTTCRDTMCVGTGTSCPAGSECVNGRCDSPCPILDCGTVRTLPSGRRCVGDECVTPTTTCRDNQCQSLDCGGCPRGTYCSFGQCLEVVCATPLCNGACCLRDEVCLADRCQLPPAS